MRGLRRISVVGVLAVGLVPASGIAGPLDPTAFASLGAFPSLAGSYTINTSASGAPTLIGPGGASMGGVYYQDSPGHTVAVFDFSSISIASGQTITASGAVPLVLLSRGDATIGGVINGNGTISAGGPGGGGPSNAGPGAGSYFLGDGSGGGFGGAGGSSGVYTPFVGPPLPPLPGGRPYGDLSASLQGGSAGGGFAGGGGGGIEIGAVGVLNVLFGGLIEVNGTTQQFGLGGGSGGGLFLHANSGNFQPGSLLSARGGDGGGPIVVGGPGGGTGGGGGGGGGGRILAEFNVFSPGELPIFDLAGGLGGAPSLGTTDGRSGVLTITFASVPEPSSLAMVATAMAIGSGWRWRRGHRPGGPVNNRRG